MSLKRQLGVSFLIQGAGAAAVLLATLWLGARLGPEVQGGFSRTKSEIEFVASFAMFGLPQALFYYLKSGALSTRGAMRWAIGSACVALPIALVNAFLQHPGLGAGPWVCLALAIAATVAQGQLRSLLLVGDKTLWFNLVTAAPQVLVLIGVGASILAAVAPSTPFWFAVFGLANALAAGVACLRLRGRTADVSSSSVGWRPLVRYGLAAWLTAALATAAILAMQRWVEASQGRAALGQFTMAMTLTQVPLTPVNYAAPLLLRRWMERPGAPASRRWAMRLFLGLLGVAALVALASLGWPDLGLGSAYAGSTLALAVLLVGAAAEASSRVLTVHASASGLPWVAVRAEATRWLLLALAWCLWPAHGLLVLCASWSVAATGAALVFARHAQGAR